MEPIAAVQVSLQMTWLRSVRSRGDLGVIGEREHLARATPPRRWLSILENELRRRTGWVNEAISPFARALHKTPPKPGRLKARVDTLLFPDGEERKSA